MMQANRISYGASCSIIFKSTKYVRLYYYYITITQVTFYIIKSKGLNYICYKNYLNHDYESHSQIQSTPDEQELNFQNKNVGKMKLASI